MRKGHPAKLAPGRALRRFGFRQTIRGAVVLGLLIGIIMGAQGAGYAALYPSQRARDQFVASLQSAPAINFMSGEIANAAQPDSYMIYKSITLVTVATAVWGLLVTTRLLRGFEEDGQLELLQAGAVSKLRAGSQLLAGFAGSFVVSAVLAFACMAAFGANTRVGLPPAGAALTTAGIFLPGLLFAGVGVLVSQLAASRGRALGYGLVPLVLLFVLRGIGNGDTGLNWLKQFTPFGWTDLLNPVLGPHAIWLLPPVLFAAVLAGVGLSLAGHRDLGVSLIHTADTVRPHTYLLGSALQLAVRQYRWQFVWWTASVLGWAALMASLVGVAAGLVSDSTAGAHLSSLLGGQAASLKLLFLGASALIVAIVLVVLSAVGLSGIRGDEAKGYLDNVLVGPVRRSFWLGGRLLLILLTVVAIALLAGTVTWLIAGAQGIHMSLDLVLQNAVGLAAVVWLSLGIGTLFYGWLPRLGVISMYVALIWAFGADILEPAIPSAKGFIQQSSLFHYIPLVVTRGPDWPTVARLLALAFVLAVIGVFGFVRRDIVAE